MQQRVSSSTEVYARFHFLDSNSPHFFLVPFLPVTQGACSPGLVKLEVVKQEMARMNIDILGISELKWTGMGEFNADDHCIYYCGQEFLRRNGVAIMVNKRVRNAVLGCNLKNNRMISVHFQGKPFNITVESSQFSSVQLLSHV